MVSSPFVPRPVATPASLPTDSTAPTKSAPADETVLVVSTDPPTLEAKTARDKIVASASSFEDLVLKAQALDPALASKLQGQATLASATPVGALFGSVLGYAVSHYGLHWDPAFIELLSGSLALGFGYLTHYVQTRMTSLEPKAK